MLISDGYQTTTVCGNDGNQGLVRSVGGNVIGISNLEGEQKGNVADMISCILL
jgi:hypothetical protein